MVNALSLSLPLCPTGLSEVYRHYSAQAWCRLQNSVLHIDYSGAISQVGFQRLDLAVLPWRDRAPVALERMDKAITMAWPGAMCATAWPLGTPPSVVIVRDDQYVFADEFCTYLATRGVIRVAFRKSQSEMAMALVERIAGRSLPL